MKRTGSAFLQKRLGKRSVKHKFRALQTHTHWRFPSPSCGRRGKSVKLVKYTGSGGVMHQILIIGGGAGGLKLATRLGNRLGKRKKAKIVLADRYPVHVWKPLLHEVAAGSMDPFAHQIENATTAR